jgi:hypothetical protein
MSRGARGAQGLFTCNIVIDKLDNLMFEDWTLRSSLVNATSDFNALFASDIYGKMVKDILPSKLCDPAHNTTFVRDFSRHNEPNSSWSVSLEAPPFSVLMISLLPLQSCTRTLFMVKEIVSCILVQSKDDAMITINHSETSSTR